MTLDMNEKLDFNNVLIKPKRSTLESRSQVSLVRPFKTKYGDSSEFIGVPIIASNMATGTFAMLRELSKHSIFTAIAKHHNPYWMTFNHREETDLVDYGFYTLGMNDVELEELKEFRSLLENQIGNTIAKRLKLCIDIANGYTQKFASFVNKVRNEFPDNVIIAGNVATPEMTQELIINGADMVKIGIGPGSQCTTRLKTGVGYPQISASIECADSAHGLGGGIILDGGMRNSGDVCKAFCANSDMVMLGGMFAGTDECDGEIITRHYSTNEMIWKDGDFHPTMIERKFKLFYGMSSDYAQEQHFGGKKDYRTSEGRVEEVEYKGSVTPIVEDILGGLRSCGTYIGASSIKDFGKCATLCKVPRVHDRF